MAEESSTSCSQNGGLLIESALAEPAEGTQPKESKSSGKVGVVTGCGHWVWPEYHIQLQHFGQHLAPEGWVQEVVIETHISHQPQGLQREQ